MAAITGNKMTAQLAEIVAKAARDPDAYHDLSLVYQRGHDLSGITRFEARAGGAFRLSITNPRRNKAVAFEGTLEEGQRRDLLSAIDETGLLAVPSSTRPIADDELPLVIELDYDQSRHRLLIWADDARANADLGRFERALWPILRQLAGDELGPVPPTSAA